MSTIGMRSTALALICAGALIAPATWWAGSSGAQPRAELAQYCAPANASTEAPRLYCGDGGG
jgi:hypothetical protein